MPGRLSAYRSLIAERLTAAFQGDHPPRQVAATFGFGIFVASLPNFGAALVLFAGLAYAVERVSNLALVASVVVMNPLVKWGVYAVSLWVGNRLLGPAPGASISEFSLSVGSSVLLRLFVGNLVVSAVLGVAGYALALRFVRELRRRDVELAERLPGVSTE
jgi:uncharacterized protein (DUF2062 family)